MRNLEGIKYPVYADFVYVTIIKVMKKYCKNTRTRRRKILKYKKLPVEALIIFKALEETGFDINTMPEPDLEKALDMSFSLFDRDSDYDRELMRRVGHLEAIRWRTTRELKDESSFYKIVKLLREFYIGRSILTKIGQNPRVSFVPKGDYHNKQSLT
jgi:hypothetical protein